MNRDLLEVRLRKVFDPADGELRVVVRQAGDLADSGRYAESHGVELSVDRVVAELGDAPDDLGLVERWNWWVGSLDLAHGGYGRFRVRRWD